MSQPAIDPSAYHELPEQMEELLRAQPDLLEVWNSLTPIMRNEWICRITIPKKQETRDEHLVRRVEDLGAGKKRPCCRPGCPHRRESAKKWFK